MTYLYSWLTRYWSHSESDISTTYRGVRIPSLSQCLDWISLLMDAHLPRFHVDMSNTESSHHDIIQNIMNLIQQQYIPMCEHMSGIKGIMSEFRSQYEQYQKKHQHHIQQGTLYIPNKGDVVPDYCVEVLHF